MNPEKSTEQLEVVRQLARLLDSAVQVPGLNFRVGLDALLGLLPVLGDLISSGMGAYIVLVASRLGVSRPVLTRMTFNLMIDTLLGAIPLFGDIFDVLWKANIRNVALLERALTEPQATRRASIGVLVGMGLATLLLLAGGVLLVVWLVPPLLQQG